MTAFGLNHRTTPVPFADPRPPADVIPIGGRPDSPAAELVLLSLADAAAVVPVSVELLWVEYLTLGGTGELTWFRAHLGSPDPVDIEEHRVVVQAFTELFADEGLALRVV